MLQVRVTVLDKNDVAPTWDSSPWKFQISEEALPNTVVTVLKARDPDTIGTLTYTLVPNHRRHRHHHPDNYTEPFAKNNNNNNDVVNDADDFDDGTQQFQLHPTTGQLTLAEALDRETKEKYVLRVRADDGLQHRDIVLNIQVRMRYTCTDIRKSLINKRADIKSILYRVNIKNSLNYRYSRLGYFYFVEKHSCKY